MGRQVRKGRSRRNAATPAGPGDLRGFPARRPSDEIEIGRLEIRELGILEAELVPAEIDQDVLTAVDRLREQIACEPVV